jgi:inorganic triphosphatase YgiF
VSLAAAKLGGVEVELKFQVPAARRVALRRALAGAGARTVRLRARYFDTEEARLAAAGLALRLRDEGGGWVQAVKGRGEELMQRLEHEVPLPRGRGVPALDVSRHDGTAAGAALRRALGDDARLVEVFATDIRRTLRRVRSGGATIEIALDVGHLAVPVATAGRRREAVHEVEFELLAGAPTALPALAARWVPRFGLWWDVRTKAQRGQRLAAAATAGPADERAVEPVVKAQASALDDAKPLRAALATMIDSCLAHALPNLAALAEGHGTPEHLHQARVALRRLRSVLRECAAFGGDEAEARALEQAWREPFARLGAARDRDVARALGPVLADLGLPALAAAAEQVALCGDAGHGGARAGRKARPQPQRTPQRPGHRLVQQEVAGSELQLLLLRTVGLAVAARARADAATAAPPSTREAPMRAAAAKVLQRCCKRALGDAGRFRQLGEEQQHRVRKRLKRLRYVFDFFAPLHGRRAGRRFARRLEAAAEALGRMNDLAVVERLFASALTPAVQQRLDAERARAVRRAQRELLELRRTPRPWR